MHIKKNDKDDNNKYQDLLLKNIEEIFTSKEYDISILEKGQDEILITEKMTVTLTTTKNQKNNTEKNVTTIDIIECEDKLRKYYKLCSNDLLFIKKLMSNKKE